jgi:DNA-binding CsgD family transcriptional regulator
VTADLFGEPHFADGSWRSGAHSHSLSGSCPACGAPLPAESGHGPVLRATVPQPIAAALRLTSTLSARERVVFELLGMGYDNRSIARDMNISERTVKRHITVILAKLHLESRLQAGLTALIISMCSPVRAAWPEGRIVADSPPRDN